VKVKRGVPRARFDILAVFDTAYVRFTSDKTRSLPPEEIVACLRKYADAVEHGIAGGRDRLRPGPAFTFWSDLAAWHERSAALERDIELRAFHQTAAQAVRGLWVLANHFTEANDPCADRGVEWPCDVARAFLYDGTANHGE
jgi:hypothetical protein